jgi:hypothetical protein
MPDRKPKFSLKDFQFQFVDALFAKEQNNAFISSITPAGKLADGASALRVHQRGYVCRLTEALGEIYDGVWSVLGDQDFFKVCESYITSNCSASYNLTDYGRIFYSHLEKSVYAEEFPFLPDLAQFELAFSDAFHAREHEQASSSELARIEQEPYAVLHFGPSVLFLSLKHAVYQIWKSRKEKNRVVPDFFSPEYLVLYKKDGLIFIQHLKSQEFDMLTALKSGMTVGDYLDDPVRTARLQAEDVSNVFYFLASAGLVEAIKAGAKK